MADPDPLKLLRNDASRLLSVQARAAEEVPRILRALAIGEPRYVYAVNDSQRRWNLAASDMVAVILGRDAPPEPEPDPAALVSAWNTRCPPRTPVLYTDAAGVTSRRITASRAFIHAAGLAVVRFDGQHGECFPIRDLSPAPDPD